MSLVLSTFFLFTEAHSIQAVSPKEGTKNYAHQVFNPIELDDSYPPAAIDYNSEAEAIYWTSNTSQAILQASSLGGNSSVLLQLDSGVWSTGLSVDWITGNVYYADSSGRIGVVSADGSYHAVLIDNLDGISDLVVNSLAG